MALWPGPEGIPADSASLQSSPVRDRVDALYWMDLKIARAEAESPSPSMRVYVHPSYGHSMRVDAMSPLFWAGGYTSTLSAPSTNPRYDLVYIVPSGSGSLGVVTGSENASPVIPAVPDEAIPVAVLYMRVGMTSIKNVDDSSNGYIIYRVQPFLGMGSGGVSVKLKSGTNQTVSNTLAETTITAATKTIPGGLLGTDNYVDLFIEITDLDLLDSDNLVLRAKYDGTTFASITIDPATCATIANGSCIVWVRLRNDASTSAQRGWMAIISSSAVKAAAVNDFAVGSASVNSAIDKDVTFTVDFSAASVNNSVTVNGQSIVKYS